MKLRFVIVCLSLYALLRAGYAQEAATGFDMRTTLSGEVVAADSGTTAGARAVFYPEVKLPGGWDLSAAVQVRSTPYFFEELDAGRYGARGSILQASIRYSRFAKWGSLVFRAGELQSAFGSFLLRYDDADNWQVGMPPSYGYYYKPVTTLALTGAQADVTAGKLDARVQLTSSSPVNRRNPFDRDQYANWTVGAGYTVVQGFRIGVSAFRGPFLDRGYRYYFPGEAKPRDLPASAAGVDVQWARGPWNVTGEWQRFVMEYRAIPNFREQVAYGEVRRTLHPRWYAAARLSALRTSIAGAGAVYEFTAGYRPNRRQLVKIGYEEARDPGARQFDGIFAVQLVTSIDHIR